METIEKISKHFPSTITKELDPKQFLDLVTSHPERIKRSKFIVGNRIGCGLKAKILVEFENGK